MQFRLEMKLMRTVAICLNPPELSQQVLTTMNSLISENFLFSEEREEAQIVVSNSESLIGELSLDEDLECISVVALGQDLPRIVDFLMEKFELEPLVKPPREKDLEDWM